MAYLIAPYLMGLLFSGAAVAQAAALHLWTYLAIGSLIGVLLARLVPLDRRRLSERSWIPLGTSLLGSFVATLALAFVDGHALQAAGVPVCAALGAFVLVLAWRRQRGTSRGGNSHENTAARAKTRLG